MVVFYQLFGLVFFVITRTQPPPSPAWETARKVQWFNDNHHGLLIGFAVMFVITGMTAPINALIAYSMRRMSVSPVFGYTYLVMYSLSAIPGMLLLCLALTAGAMCPDRDPELIGWIYDFAFLSFVGTMGVFLIGSLVWMLAILIDKKGELAGTYRKVHLAQPGEVWWGVTPGHDLPVYDLHGAKVAMNICMDSSALESVRVPARKGAEIVCLPIMGDHRASTSWYGVPHDFDIERWTMIQRVRAMDNHVYMVVSRNVGYGTGVFSPRGETLAISGGHRAPVRGAGTVWIGQIRLIET